METILKSVDTSNYDNLMYKFHPKIYEIDLTSNKNYAVRIEDNFKSYNIDKNLTIEQIFLLYP